MAQLSQMETIAFTKQKYEKILKTINKNNTTNHVNLSTNSANADDAGSSDFLATFELQKQIIDIESNRMLEHVSISILQKVVLQGSYNKEQNKEVICMSLCEIDQVILYFKQYSNYMLV